MMEREIGRWNKATGITRPIAGQEEWVELWIGDVIECRVYITDRAGCYLHITGEVVWEKSYGMYSVFASYNCDGQACKGFFPLHKIVNDNIKFLKMAPREFGNQRDILFHIIGLLKTASKAPVKIGDLLGKLSESSDELDKFYPAEVQAVADTVTYDMLDSIIEEIGKMRVVPAEEITKAFAGD
jgi:hypothetical protein